MVWASTCSESKDNEIVITAIIMIPVNILFFKQHAVVFSLFKPNMHYHYWLSKMIISQDNLDLLSLIKYSYNGYFSQDYKFYNPVNIYLYGNNHKINFFDSYYSNTISVPVIMEWSGSQYNLSGL